MRIINIFYRYSNRNFFVKLKKEIVFSTMSQVILLLQLVIQNKIFAVNFSKLEYGDWSLLLSIFVLISMIPFTAFDQAIAKMANGKLNSPEKYYFTNNIYAGYLFLFFIHCFLLYSLISLFFSSSIISLFFIPFLIYTFSEIFKNSIILMENAVRNRKNVMLSRTFELIFRIILLGILSYTDIFNIIYVFYGFSLGNIILSVTYYKKFDIFIKYIKLDKIMFYYKEILLFSYPLIIWAIFGWLQNMINRWYISYYLSTEIVASYTILISLSFFIPNAIYGIINNFLMPYVFSKKNNTSFSTYKYFLLSVTFLLIVYTVFISITSDYLVILLADQKYLDISSFIPFLTMSSSIYVVAMLSTFEIYRSGETKLLLVPTILPGIFSLIGGFFLISQFGLFGAVVNYIAGQTTYSILVLYISSKHIRRININVKTTNEKK